MVSWVICRLAGLLLLHYAMIVLSEHMQIAKVVQDSTNSSIHHPIDYQSITTLLKHCFAFGMPFA